VWDHSTISKNRDRLLEAEVAAKFLETVLRHPKVKRFLSQEHFSVDGTLVKGTPRALRTICGAERLIGATAEPKPYSITR
jgi:hypothetical protein